MGKELKIKELQSNATALAAQIKTAVATKEANARAAALYSANEREETNLWSKLHQVQRKLEHLTKYENREELSRIVHAFHEAAEEDGQCFKFFEYADANFAQTTAEGRRLHVDITCGQVCDHDIKNVLENAERVAGRKLVDWFVSANIGYNPRHDAKAWLTYHLTFEGRGSDD